MPFRHFRHFRHKIRISFGKNPKLFCKRTQTGRAIRGYGSQNLTHSQPSATSAMPFRHTLQKVYGLCYNGGAYGQSQGALEATITRLSESVLKQLIKGGETNRVELKVAAPRSVEMAERLCGMANAQGGMIIIGVKDIRHEIVGIPDHRIGETLDVILRAVRQMIKPELVLDPPEPEIYTVAGKKLVVATVKPSHGPVYQAHGIYWVRRGTHTVSLGLSELLEMANDRGLVDWEHQPAHNATMEDIDLEKVKAYLARRSANDRQASRFKDLQRVLIGMECAVKTNNGEVVPTNAGILFFGYA